MNGIGFEYDFQNIYNIFSSLKLNSGDMFLYLPFLVIAFVAVYLCIYRFGPIYFMYLDYRKEKKNKRKKKEFIERIKLQNEIEDEVEKELK